MPVGTQLARSRQPRQHIALPAAAIPLDQIEHAGLQHKETAIDPVSITERILSELMASGLIPKADPALKAAMALGLLTQAGQNKIYNRLPGPLSQHAEALTRAVIAVLKTP